MLRSFVSVAAALFFIAPLCAQRNFEQLLANRRANKIILIGDWKEEDRAKWWQLANSEGIFEYGFVFSDRVSRLSYFNALGPVGASDYAAFENWLMQRYSLGRGRWAALDMDNRLVVTGSAVPVAEELDKMLERGGLLTPLRQTRSFLRENPNHIDAKTDLLKEVRRRALTKSAPNIVEDLDTATDLRTWGVMAAEIDNVFKGEWLGIDLDFFRPDENPPERFSKLMRKAFRKHIASVESALREQPTNRTLWNIWGWMARSQPDYKWNPFVDSLETIASNLYNSVFESLFCPSEEVCVWLIENSRAKADWESVIKYAKVADRFTGYFSQKRTTWSPTGYTGQFSRSDYEGYPNKPITIPCLEALLRLGRTDEANSLFDKMMRFTLDSGIAKDAAAAARSAGMEEIAEVWEKGQLLNRAPYAVMREWFAKGPLIMVVGDRDYYGKFNELFRSVSPRGLALVRRDSLMNEDLATLSWSGDVGNRWGLLDSDGLLLFQDTSIPSADEFKNILVRFNIETDAEAEFLHKYIARHRDQPGVILYFALYLLRTNPQSETLDEAANLMAKLLNESPTVFLSVGTQGNYEQLKNSESLKQVSKKYLANIESLLERKPSSDGLWYHWFLFRDIEGANRPTNSILGRIKFSPLSKPGLVPPGFVMTKYYNECKANGDWAKVIELLKDVWDRAFYEYQEDRKPGQRHTNPKLGDELGIPLMEACLNDHNPALADEYFRAWLEAGGTFADIAKVIELAKEKGFERYATEWERRSVKK